MNSDVSVVIAHFYHSARGKNLLPIVYALLDGSVVPKEILIWNNDEATIRFPRLPACVRIIQSPYNQGPSARFLAAQEATGHYVLFQGNDLEVERDTIKNLLTYARDNAIVCLEGRWLACGENYLWSAGHETLGSALKDPVFVDISLGRLELMTKATSDLIRLDIPIPPQGFVPGDRFSDDDIYASHLANHHHIDRIVVPCVSGSSSFVNLDEGRVGISYTPTHWVRRDALIREFFPDSVRTRGGQTIPLSHPALTAKALTNVTDVLTTRKMAGDGTYTKQCQEWLEHYTGCARALLTHSGTGALDLATLLANIQPGDEVIMPSFTYPATATSVVLRGGIPVFVDIRPDTLNIDETLVEAAITPKTKAIIPVHYGGVICDMTALCEIAARHQLTIIEDAAQALGSDHSTQPYGQLSAISFHDTKNMVCGEGGALLVHDAALVDRAEVLWFSGTDRRKFLDGLVDYYTWQDLGSSFLPSELQAAVLQSQLDVIDNFTQQRKHIWQLYHRAFEHLDVFHRPTLGHNAHLYYILVPAEDRPRILAKLHQWGVGASFHYIPLHSSPAGLKYGRVATPMTYTDMLSQQLIRLPLYVGNEGMTDMMVFDIIQKCETLQL